MKKIIALLNSEPAVIIPAMTGVNIVTHECPDGEKTHPTVMATGSPFLTGNRKVIYVAVNQHATSEEILETAIKLSS